MDVKYTLAAVDVKYTLAGVDDAECASHVAQLNTPANTEPVFELQELCAHITQDNNSQPNALVELDARTRALIRPYMTIDTLIKQTDGATTLLSKSLLLDSGSLDASYIGAGTLRDYPNIVQRERETNTTVYMADKKTRLPINKKVYLNLTIETPGKDAYNFVGWFGVLGDRHGIILGYPDLLQMPRHVFDDRFDIARQKLAEHFRNLRSNRAIKVMEDRPRLLPRQVPHFTVQRVNEARQWQYLSRKQSRSILHYLNGSV